MISFLLFIASITAAPHELIGQRFDTPRTWVKERSAHPHEPLTFTIFLKQTGLETLKSLFQEISNPDSEKYRQFLTKSELDEIVKAPEGAHKEVMNWLNATGAGEFQVVDRTSDTIKVQTKVRAATRLFKTDFHFMRHKRTSRTKIVFTGKLMIPANIHSLIDMITGMSELYDMPSRKNVKKKQGDSGLKSTDTPITPELLRTFYKIPSSDVNTASENYQCIAAFDDYFSDSAFKYFWQNFTNTDGPDVKWMGPDCLDDQKPCDQFESDLDMQYITSTGQGVKTLFHNMADSSAWVLEFSEAAQQLSPFPMVFSISYGWMELSQCQVAFESCNKLGYDAAQYVSHTETNFQRMGVMGASIFVSDGDDGASSVTPPGWNPIDMEWWCPGEYECYPHSRGESKCGEVLLKNTTSGETCVWPVGQDNQDGPCTWLYLGDFYQPADIFKAIKDQNPNCNMDLSYDTDYGVHMYSECTCDQISMTHEDVVAQAYKVDVTDTSKRLFWADFPTSSAYVTSVGATQFIASSDGSFKEIVASIKTGAIITTGGGFSSMQDAPAWQKNQLNSWNNVASNKPPSSLYDISKRGYPDVTMNGHNYQVGYSKGDNGECPCDIGGVDGTSASSPAFAGMISLINGHLLSNGQKQLGFVNPLLYKMYTEHPAAFNDVTEGDNKCSRNYCFEYGYAASTGWDPVSGLGSPNYAEMLDYIMNNL